MAYLDLTRVKLDRRTYMEPPPNRQNRANIPVRMRYLKLLKHHTPPDPYRDPYFIAVLIALAQKQRRSWRQRPGPGAAPSYFTVWVLLFFPGTTCW